MITTNTDAGSGRPPGAPTPPARTLGSAVEMSEPDLPYRDDTATEPSTGRRPLALALLVLIVVAAAVGAFFAFRGDDHKTPSNAASTRSGSPGAEREVVAELNGDGDKETKSFTVKDGWEIRWETTGASLQVAITGDRDFGTVINQVDAGGGATYPVGSGTFRLAIKARGPWTIKVVNHTAP